MPTIAYFSMEFAVDPRIPTYSGGLGILSGDTLRAATDLGLPMVGVTLLHRRGYFIQHLDDAGNQTESCANWPPNQFLQALPPRVMVTIEGRQVTIQTWRYLVSSESGNTVPLYFLDTALPDNSPEDRAITDYLYGGDESYRLRQEAVLGLGGVAMLRALGHQAIRVYHMNEGHSALIALALLEEHTWGRTLTPVSEQDREAVRQRCVFTTHTPVPAGHDRFPVELVRRILGNERTDCLIAARCCSGGFLDMTQLALAFSRFVNGVSMRHEEVSQAILNSHHIDAITNGVHAGTWVSAPFARIYDKHIPQWRRDNLYLRYALRIPLDEIAQAHAEAKQHLLCEVKRRTGVQLDPGMLTIGFARRIAAYKRPDLLFYDIERLRRVVSQSGHLQVIYAGKAHPRDEWGKQLVNRVFVAARELKDTIPIIYLEDYDIELAKYLCSGVDVWLNTPQKPQEASGTSGMKAALNGVPSLSILDGWWIEGHIENVTGWSIGDCWQAGIGSEYDAASLYDKLEQVVIPTFYQQPQAFSHIMQSAIAQNGSYFNAQRMMTQYSQNAYLLWPSGRANNAPVHDPATA